jgi:hypothetical protein
LEATGHQSEYIHKVREQFDRIAETRADLAERYWKAVATRQASEMERLLTECGRIIREDKTLSPVDISTEGAPFRAIVTDIDNLRSNGATGRFHVGNGYRSVPLFSERGPTQH